MLPFATLLCPPLFRRARSSLKTPSSRLSSVRSYISRMQNVIYLYIGFMLGFILRNDHDSSVESIEISSAFRSCTLVHLFAIFLEDILEISHLDRFDSTSRTIPRISCKDATRDPSCAIISLDVIFYARQLYYDKWQSVKTDAINNYRRR
jgi:hypothetical protein